MISDTQFITGRFEFRFGKYVGSPDGAVIESTIRNSEHSMDADRWLRHGVTTAGVYPR
jgi:hypothetical protein